MEIRKDRETDFQRAERNDPGVAFAAVHSQSNEAKVRHDEEKMSIFWRVFGGTILSIGALITVTVYNNTAGSLSELRSEISRLNEARGELIKKDEFNTRLSTSYERVQNLQSQNNNQNAMLTSVQTAVTELKDRLTAIKTDSEVARKEATVATDAFKKEIDAVKKELASLETVKEKMTMVLAEIKDHRDDIAKLRQDSECNLAADSERKKNRDDQYTKLLDAIKELDRAMRMSGEKIARLEGSVAPVKPMKPSTPTAPHSGNDE